MATTRRERYREETRSEIKAYALRQLADSGHEGLSLNAIAREMGMTGPALYRYFGGRDELVTELVVDAYNDLADAVAAAVDGARRRSPVGRLRALGVAIREWAIAQPHRYLLLFGTPIPGYQAPDTATAAARRIFDPVLAIAAELAADSGAAGESAARRRGALDRQLEAGPWVPEEYRGTLSGPVLARCLLSWSRLHGLVSLEVNGQFGPMDFDPALLYEAELDALAQEFASAIR